MPNYTVIGLDAMVEQPQTGSRSKESGLTYTRTFRGPPDLTIVNSKVNEMWLAGAVDVKYTTGKVSEVVATFNYPTTGSEAVDNATWELFGSDLSKPLAAHPAFNVGGTASVEVLELIESEIEEGIAHLADYNTDFPDGSQYNRYRDLRLQQVTSYFDTSWIIRKTVQSSRDDTFEDALAYPENSVISYAAIGVPTRARFKQPQYRKYAGNGSGATDATYPVNEWLVKPAQCRWTGKVYEMTQEWWGAIEWDTQMYKHL